MDTPKKIAELEEREAKLTKALESIYYQLKRGTISHDEKCTCTACETKRFVAIALA